MKYQLNIPAQANLDKGLIEILQTLKRTQYSQVCDYPGCRLYHRRVFTARIIGPSDWSGLTLYFCSEYHGNAFMKLWNLSAFVIPED